tara:strand:+ start:112 stop:465 length:354 start_codon:yes stop_codon:yes gene_type:complete
MPRVVDGSKFTTLGVTVGTGATALYTVPSNYASVIRHLSLNNNNSAAKKITAQYYDSKAARYYFLTEDLSIAANSFINIVDGNFISLNANDKIVLSAETAGTISALISVEEYYDPNR